MPEIAHTNTTPLGDPIPPIDPPLYQDGYVELDQTTLDYLRANIDLTNCSFGVQVAPDGRVWCCVNGQTFLRFKPRRGTPS